MKKYEFIKDRDDRGNETVSVSYMPKRKLDLIPRLICLMIALVIWLWMVNFNDTDVTETMVLKIDYVGLETLEGKEMMIYAMDKSEITVTVKGSNRDIKKYDTSEYSAVVDVSSISEVGPHTLPMTIRVPAESNVTVIESEPLNLSLVVDFSETKHVPFDVTVIPAPESGHMKYSYISYIEPEISYIGVTGPKSIIDQISSARFNVNGNFVTSTDKMEFSDFPLVFLDKNFNEIDTLKAVEYTTEDIFVNVMASAHKNITLNVKVSGEGSDLIAKPSMDSIEIWGDPMIVSQINEYTITLDKAELGKTATYTMTGDLFPEGVNVKENITIIISFEMPIS